MLVCLTLNVTHCVAFPICNHRRSSLSPLRQCECFDLHRDVIPYGKALKWQKSIVGDKKKKAAISGAGDCSDTLIVLQHRPVYTVGTGSSAEFLKFDADDSPYEFFRTERGGEVTFHGPGQLVLYPIINLRNHKMDLHWYLRALEEVVIRALMRSFSIEASRIDGLTGVWVGNQKLAAIGIKVSQWITYHGLALNVTTDLLPFSRIVPCGIRDKQVGSIKGLLAESQPSINHLDDCQFMDITSQSLIDEFSQIFRLEIHHKAGSELDIRTRNFELLSH